MIRVVASFAFILFSLPLMSQQTVAQRIDALFSKQFPPDEPGGAILIAFEDKIIFRKGYGIADINTREPISPHSIFNTGSVSKTFVSNAILVLEKRGLLGLDDPLDRYFPGFKNKEIARKVTIRHLLTHSSGLPDCREVSKNPVFYLTADDEENFAPIQQTDTLVFEPGTRYQYSNPAFNGLALIIEKVTGAKWQDFVKREIFLPSGMTESDITDGAHPETGVAHGYERKNNGFAELDYGEEPTFCAAGNGGIWCSVTDLHRYYLALMNAAFLDRETIDASMRPQISRRTGHGSLVGFSWFISAAVNGVLRIGHTGSQGGFRADFEFVPSKKIFVGMLFNIPVETNDLMREVEKILAEEGLL